jgi:hypothetical protein
MADEPKKDKTVKTTAYIPIHNPFTVDLSRDQRDTLNSPAGHFRTLTNYIPTHSIIETRRGITLFVQSASAPPTTAVETAGAPAANDFTGDPNIVSLWKLENNLLDSIGTNHFTGIGTIAFITADVSEGDYCLDLEKTPTTAHCTIVDTNLDAGTVGKKGENPTSLSIFGFFNMESYGNQNSILGKYRAAGADRSFAVNCKSASGDFVFQIGYNGGNNASTLIMSAGLTLATWYWFCATYNLADDKMDLYLWNRDTSALVSHVSGTAAGTFAPSSAALTLGLYGSNNTFDGKIDETGLARDMITTAEMNALRTQTYEAPANDFSSTAIVSVWNFEDNGNDSKGSHDLTPQNAPTYSTEFMQGDKSVNLNGVGNQYYTLPDSSCSTYMPGKSGGTARDFGILGWVKVGSASFSQGILGKWWWVDKRSWLLALETTTYEPKFYIGYDTAVQSTLLKYSSQLTVGEWYHICCTYRESDNFMKIRVRNRNGVLVGGNSTTNAGGTMSMVDEPIEFGRFNRDNSLTALGRFDEWVIMNQYMTNTEIDKIFNKTFT